MPIRKPHKRKTDDQAWLTTYADALTLVLCFFVLLLSASSFNPEKYSQIKDAMMEQMMGPGPTEKDEISASIDPKQLIKEQAKEFERMVEHLRTLDGVEIYTTSQGIRIEIRDRVLFRSGSAVIRYSFLPSLNELSSKIADFQQRNELFIEVEGHTDDVIIETLAFPSNWELSARRATNVLRFMIESGVEPDKMRAVAFAHTSPKLPNRDPKGQGVAKNRAANRRVVLELKKVTTTLAGIGPEKTQSAH